MNMKNQKKIIMVSVIFFLLAIVIGVMIFAITKGKKPEDTFTQYVANLKEKNYEAMYEMLSNNSKETISKEDFMTRNKNIYEGIEAENIEVTIKETKKEKEETIITYEIKMDTAAGNIKFENTMTLIKEEKENKVKWSSNDIFPKLGNTDKVRVKTTKGTRGNIYDRNKTLLAGEGTASSIGFVPGKMNQATKQEDIKALASLLGISEEKINQTLSASWVKEDSFVPLRTVEKGAQDLKNKALMIKGVKITDTKTRIYPYGEVTSHVLGYTQNISAEELKQLEGKGYTSSSVIGKSGVEKDYEDRLKPTNGCQIFITDEQGNTKQVLAETKLKNGQDITLTLDITLQEKLYKQFKTDKSCSVMMNYQTGELLALVSTPTFNSNDFSFGMTNEQWNRLNTNEEKPLYNRYKQTWAPGSSFKPVIGAIGMTTNALDPNENFGRSGTSWQKDSSWGSYYITTLKEYGDQVNLKNALIYSDNIYFAKVALKIGTETLEEQLKNISFGKNLEIDQTVGESTYGENHKIDSQIQLADSGYGQGKVLVNPIHMASIYSAFLNEGNMIKPYLVKQENKQVEYLKQGAFSKEAANIIKEDLIQVVENENGTAHNVKTEGKTIGGKTGTAEIKTSKEDANGTELGWFNAFLEDKNHPILMISMVEDVKNRGGSHYLLPKIKTIFESL